MMMMMPFIVFRWICLHSNNTLTGDVTCDVTYYSSLWTSDHVLRVMDGYGWLGMVMDG